MANILFEIQGHLGIIKLNRPEALNALNLSMIEEIHHHLDGVQQNPNLSSVLIQSTSEKAFCSGGDIRQVHDAHGASLSKYFFEREYSLNYKIAAFKKHYISLIDGICMGSGLGISVHGHYRIITEHAALAMPETGIGFFPDVGAAFFLNKLPGNLGLYLGLTGKQLSPSDALFTGLGTHFIPRETLLDFVTSLQTLSLEDALVHYSLKKIPDQKSDLSNNLEEINLFFSQHSLEDILESLKKSSSLFAQETYSSLLKKSPLSLKVTFRYFKECQNLPLKTILNRDYVLSQHFMEGSDFYEGVRALLIDKDHTPHWSPAHLKDVTSSQLSHYLSFQE